MAACAALLAAAQMVLGCKSKAADGNAANGGKKVSIQNIGSDTMVNLAQAWAEEYAKVNSSVSVEVSGGGSGIGIAALINGTADIANASRRLEPEESEKAKAHSHSEPKEYLVGYDALSIYVHKDNPMAEITIEELAELYKEGGKVSKWSELGIKNIPGAKGEDVVRVSRQNNSGTYHYFREAVLGKKSDFRAGSLDMNGSKDVVDLITKTPNAIGYAGLGYASAGVKILKVAKAKGQPAILPSIQTTLDKTYPIARPMFMYTPGEPQPQVKGYLDWVQSPAGQKVVQASGYVPLQRQ